MNNKGLPYSIFILFAAVILLIAAAYLGSDDLQKFGVISFWLSIAGRCFSFLVDYSVKNKK